MTLTLALVACYLMKDLYFDVSACSNPINHLVPGVH